MQTFSVYIFTKGGLTSGILLFENPTTFGEAVKEAKRYSIEFDNYEGVITDCAIIFSK